MLDTEGRRVYSDSTMLQVTVENGYLLGLENGNLADVTEYTAAYRRAYRGQLLIYAIPLNESEPISVCVTGEGVKTKTLVLPNTVK